MDVCQSIIPVCAEQPDLEMYWANTFPSRIVPAWDSLLSWPVLLPM